MARLYGIDSDRLARRFTSKAMTQNKNRIACGTIKSVLNLLVVVILSCCYTDRTHHPTVVATFGDISIKSVAAWMYPPSTTTMKRRTTSSNERNAFYWRDERQLLSLRSTPIPTSNIDDDTNKEDVVSSSSSPLLNIPFLPSSSCKVDQMSGTDLAYIGDVVYELYIRTRTVWPLKRTTDLQQQVVALVRGTN